MEIKGLKDSLGITEEQVDHLRKLKVQVEQQAAQLYMHVWKNGGNIHGVDHEATAKRRKANKVARKQRKINRG